MATTGSKTDGSVALDRIRVPENVRELDGEHVQALARSIKVQGMLVPLVVRPLDGGFELVAGFHRVAAAVQLGLREVPVVIREAETEEADRAVENIARKQLDACEEARAVKAMLDRGLSEDGAAQALGWPKSRVTARMKLLELPEQGQKLVGSGVVPLRAVDQLCAIGRVSSDVLTAMIEYLATDEWAGQQLGSDPTPVIANAVSRSKRSVFVAHLDTVDGHDLSALKLGKKAEEQFEEARSLERQLNPYSYGSPIRFSEGDVDQARAAGVLIELDHRRPLIVDRTLYRALAKGAISRSVEELRVKATEDAERKKLGHRRSSTAVNDPVSEATSERNRQLRQLGEQAHGVNLDLGAGLINGLSAVDPQDLNVARFFVYGLLGPDYQGSSWGKAGERVQHLAVAGVRLVVEELRTDVTRTRKDGGRGRLKIDYGDPKEPEAAIEWLWRFLDGARTAGQLYGRALVVIAAEQYASRLVLPASQRTYRQHWGSHRDLAAKALKKLAGRHLPASLKQLERAVTRVHAAHNEAVERPAPATDAAGGSAHAEAVGA